jgi:hypothetical protein
VEVAFVKTPFVTKTLEPVAFVKLRVVTVEEPALKAPVRERVVPEAFVNVVFWRFVVPEILRLEPVAFVKLRVVTVEEPALKLPVRLNVVPDPFVKL